MKELLKEVINYTRKNTSYEVYYMEGNIKRSNYYTRRNTSYDIPPRRTT